MKTSIRALPRLLGNTSKGIARSSSRTPFSPALPPRHSIFRAAPRLNLRPAPFSTFTHHNAQLTAPASINADPSLPDQPPRPDQPTYQLTFTCKPCKHRSAHKVSKQGYHKGTILIQCPSCYNRHVISDHLKIFMDESSTLEDILQKEGTLIKKGKLGIRHGKTIGNEGEEDIEFWEDGSETTHKGADS